MSRIAGPAVLALLLAGCASKPPAEPKKVEPPKPVTGLTGVFRMYQMARTWAPDAIPLKAQSVNIPDPKSEDGKAGVWVATFVSESRGKQRNFSWSAVEGEGFHKDVFAQQEQAWAGPTRASKPFRIEALKTDTDKAWEVAVSKSAEYMKKNPDLPVFFVAEWTDRYANPTWRIVWGESISKSSYSIYVDTTNGVYVSTGR